MEEMEMEVCKETTKKMQIERLFKELEENPPDDSTSALKILGGKNIVVYGAGNEYRCFKLNVLDRFGLKPMVIIDEKFANMADYGIGPVHPFNYFPSRDDLDNSVAVICVGAKYRSEVEFYLNHVKGFKNIIYSHNIYEHNIVIYCDELKRNGPKYFKDRQSYIEAAYELFDDYDSKVVYLQFLKFFVLKIENKILGDENETQYFPDDVPLTKNYKRWINCGSYTGDTLSRFLNMDLDYDAIYCFEPSIDNYFELLKTIQSKGRSAKKVRAFPFGVWGTPEKIKFDGTIGHVSTISNKTSYMAQFISLDTFPLAMKPTFINMDIEGAELVSLKGAEKTIKRYKPDLAISVYHSPNHIWDIPLYLNSLQVGYKFYLRNYSGTIGDTVLYATL